MTKPERDEDGDPLPEAYRQLNDSYRHLRFIADKTWNQYQSGFVKTRAGQGDYPYTGVPFTGMGRTFDWGPQPVAHGGLTEFIIPAGTKVEIAKPVRPAKFCNEPLG